MKKLSLIAFVFSVAIATNGSAQGKTIPRSEYSISLSENVVNLKPGETKQLTISLLKSKFYSHSKATLGLSSSLPEGVIVIFEPAEGVFDSSVASISATETVKEGEYQIILKATVNNKTKGSIVKVQILSGVAKESISAN